VLAPSRITDPNANRSFAAYDGLGRVIAVAIGGKSGETDPEAQGDTLEHPTQWFTYDAFAWVEDEKPVSVHGYAREQYFPVDENAPVQQSVTYADGAGNVLMVKVLAEPGLAPARDGSGALVFAGSPPELQYADTSPNERWVGTGRTVLDNKGKPVKQYEPFFSDRPDYEEEAKLLHLGVTPILHYDPLGRLVRTDYPDGTFARVELSPWQTTTHDPSDTVLGSEWYAERQALTGGTADEDAEIRAAEVTAAYAAETPTVAHADVLGRAVVWLLTCATRTRVPSSTTSCRRAPCSTSRATSWRSSMLAAMLPKRTSRACWDSCCTRPRSTLAAAGASRMSVVRRCGCSTTWAACIGSNTTLRRPTHHVVRPSGGSEALVLRSVYGELAASPEASNLRGRLLRQYDGAGLVEHVAFDFAGNELETTRRLHVTATATPDWVALATETTLTGSTPPRRACSTPRRSRRRRPTTRSADRPRRRPTTARSHATPTTKRGCSMLDMSRTTLRRHLVELGVLGMTSTD
jgi:hypothetical protein